jgi:hypothetical protein
MNAQTYKKYSTPHVLRYVIYNVSCLYNIASYKTNVSYLIGITMIEMRVNSSCTPTIALEL